MHTDELFNARKVTRKKETVLNFGSTEDVKNHNDLYHKIVEDSDAMVFTHDLKGHLQTVNKAVINNLGYSKEELTGLYIEQLIPEKVRKEFTQQYLPMLQKDGKANGVIQLLTKTGKKKFWMYHNNVFTEAAGEPFAICFAQDITDRIEREEAQKMSSNTFQSAFDHSGIGMALISPDGKIIDVNNAVCAFTGYRKDEMLKMNFLELTHPDDNATDLNLLHKMLIKVINHYSIEKRYISKSKKILWALHTVSKVSNNDGTPKFFILQIVDITRKKQLTDELNRKNSELEAIKSGLINNINQLEELNYIIAHNLRGPANNIRMLAEMLKNKNEPEKPNTFQLEEDDIIKFLDEGSSSLLTSLNTLMDVVQISMNKTISYDSCDVRFIINEILNQLNSTIYEKSAVIRLRISNEFISYPKVFLESIFYNLISNALKYSSPNRAPEILISSYMENAKAVVSVKDNGLGLDLEKYGHKIFKLNQIFHTGHDSKGVGLFITKAQIESFGGNIQVKGKENEGMEFIVTL